MKRNDRLVFHSHLRYQRSMRQDIPDGLRKMVKTRRVIGSGPLRLALALVVLPSSILWNGCTASGRKSDPTAPPPTPVMVTGVTFRDVAIFSEFAAQTYARNMVEVRGRVEGYVDQWLFHPGSDVTAGQMLYVLDLRPYEAALQQAAGNLHQSEAALEFASKQVALLQAQANLAAAQASLVKAQQDVESLTPLVQADAAS